MEHAEILVCDRRRENWNKEKLFKVDRMRLFEELCRPPVLRRGFREVSKNRGSSGIDAITVEDYKANLEQEIRELSAELKDWSYKPQPVRRVEIPKPGRRSETFWACRRVRDRVVQASIKFLLEPIIDPTLLCQQLWLSSWTKSETGY